MIPDDILQKIDDETDIVALVSEFIPLKKQGKNYVGLCPFHEENTPSFSVSPEKNIAKCMGCGEGGRPINFYRKIKNISFAESVSELAEKLGIKVDVSVKKETDANNKYYEIMNETANFYVYNLFNSVSGDNTLTYLKNRGLSKETITNFKLGYSAKDKDQLYQFLKSKDYSVTDMMDLGLVKQATDGSYYDLFNNRLMFPITNNQGKIIAFSGRTLDKNDNIKYVNSPETIIFKKGEVIYQLNEASMEIRKKGHVVIYEGFFDVISAYQAGFKNGVATMGTALTSNQASLIRRTTNKAIIAFDGDKAGINASIKAIPILSSSNINVEVLRIPNKLDPDDYIKEYGSNGYNELLNNKVFDSYQYRYEVYKEGLDLNNANDIKTFEKNITEMLKSSSPAIISLYKKRLADDLKINESQIRIKKEISPYDNMDIDLPRNTERKKLPSKYEEAEKRLFMLMTRSRVWFERIKEELTFQDYSIITLIGLRTKLSNYYEEEYSFELNPFLNLLNEEEIHYFNEVICKDDFWIYQRKLSDKEINDYINLIRETSSLRRIDYLKDKMIEKTKNGQDFTREMEELNKLQREQKLKEANNGI